MRLSLGVVDGRNVWRTDLNRALGFILSAAELLGRDRLEIAPSCSLLHVPVDLDQEEDLIPKSAVGWHLPNQKLEEVSVLVRAVNRDDAALGQIRANQQLHELRRSSRRVNNPEVRQRIGICGRIDATPQEPSRSSCQKAGCEPATAASANYDDWFVSSDFGSPADARVLQAGKLDLASYEKFLEEETVRCLRFQEETGIDVAGAWRVRTQRYGGILRRAAFRLHVQPAWLGTKLRVRVGVKPPINIAVMWRALRAMTVRWSRFAQSQTERPVKRHADRPVTILQWSFVRDDQPRSETCRQIALARAGRSL